jgi:hypothetical protein
MSLGVGGRCRRRYRKLTDDLFDPDIDPDPDADKAGMVLLRGHHYLVDKKLKNNKLCPS